MPATINDVTATGITRRAATTVAGEARVTAMPHPNMGAEDFAFMLEAKPGSYILLGAGRGEGDPTLHEPRYDFNDEILPIGASYWATLAEQSLPESP
jgi:hippurate hydrolase